MERYRDGDRDRDTDTDTDTERQTDELVQMIVEDLMIMQADLLSASWRLRKSNG